MAALTRLIRATRGFSSLYSTAASCRSFSSAVTSEESISFRESFHQSLLDYLHPARKDPRFGNVRWVFLGCRDVDYTEFTYSYRLSQLLSVTHVNIGDLVRKELHSTSPHSQQIAEFINQGKLVSDEIITKLLSKRLKEGEEEEEARGRSGFILDGFPQTIRQAEILEGLTDIDLVINLKLPEDILVEKCLGRRICSRCGRMYNVANIEEENGNIEEENGNRIFYKAPLIPRTCCEWKIITRADDTEEAIKERLRIYNNMIQPVEDFYRSRGLLMEFDLPVRISESWPKLLQALNLDQYERKKQSVAA